MDWPVGAVIGSYRLTELLHRGWALVCRATGRDGARVLATLVDRPTPGSALRELAFRLATGGSPFQGDGAMDEMARAARGVAAPWDLDGDDPRARPLAEAAGAAFDPARIASRSLAPLLAVLGAG
jgi:hypothetical protein